MADMTILLGRNIEEIGSDPLVLSLPGSGSLEVQDDRVHRIYEEAGIEFGSRRDRLISDIHLMSEGYHGFRGYKGGLPLSLEFSDSRRDVRDKIGLPAFAGGGPQAVHKLVNTPPIDRYDLDTYSLGIEYSDDEGSILSVIIQRPPANVKAKKKRGRNRSSDR